MEPKKQIHALVIKPDGTVPFDDDVPEHHRAEYLAFLADNGHTVEPIDGTRHVRIKGWKQGQDVHRPKKK